MNTVNRFRAPFLPSLVTNIFRFEQGAATRLIPDRSVYYIVHSLLSRLRKPFRYSQISSKFKQANGYTVMTWNFGSLHVKWRLRAQICHHLKFNCVTRACIFLTVLPLNQIRNLWVSEQIQKGLTGLFLTIVLVVMLGKTSFSLHGYYFWGCTF